MRRRLAAVLRRPRRPREPLRALVRRYIWTKAKEIKARFTS